MFRRGNLVAFWRPFVVALIFLLALVLWLGSSDTQESRCGACVVLVGLLWATETLPLEVTALLPVLLLPLLGIMDTGAVSKEYFNGANMMFLTAIGVAAAVQAAGLHRRIALGILMLTGTGKRSLLVSFMVITCTISMFICNTATCAMMCPILKVVLEQVYWKDLKQSEDCVNGEACCDGKALTRKQKSEQVRQDKEKAMFYLGVAYAANIGGTGTLTASEPNVILKGILDGMFPNQDSLTYATWIGYALPTIVITLTIAALWLMLLFLRKIKEDGHSSEELQGFLRQEYSNLGPVTFREATVAFYFFILVTLWFFQEPEFIPGWGDVFAVKEEVEHCGETKTEMRGMVGEATPAVLVLLLLFITPSRIDFWPFVSQAGPWEDVVLPPPLLEWKTMADFFPWGLLILRGGGFALAAGSNQSGLSDWIGTSLSDLSTLAPWLILAIVCCVTSIVTEICSNAATANILLPVLGNLAVTLGLNPLYLMLPATVTCCYAFMLPVSCPTNAIVYKASGMKSWQMLTAGIGMNIATLVVSVVAASTYGSVVLNLDEFPDWANTTDPCSFLQV